MDISNIYANAMNNASNVSADKLKSSLKSTDYSKASDDELMDVCKQFESYFLEQVYKGMMKTVPKSEFSSSSTETMVDYFKDQMIQEVSKQTTEQNDLGLAKMLYEQLKRNYGISASEVEAIEEAKEK